MAEIEERSDNGTTYLQHPLYQQAMQQMADGNDAAAAEALERLAERYPEEKDVADLLLRLELRQTFGKTEIREDPKPPKPILRNVVVFLLVITVCLVVSTGLILVWNRLDEENRIKEWEAGIQSLRLEADSRLEAGDLDGAEQVLAELEAQLGPNHGNDPGIEQRRQVIAQQRVWQDLYTQARAALVREEWQTAIDYASQIPLDSTVYDRGQAVIQQAQEGLARDAAWQEVQDLLQAEEYDLAIAALEQFRTDHGDYRRTEVEELLYQLYTVRAQPLLDRACGDVELVRRALGYMRGALRFRPANREWIEEERLAAAFLAGQEAYARGDWDAAIETWEPVYAARPGYQCGVLKRRLDDAYPRAAEQLLAEANGSEKLLSQAILYLEKLSALQPEDAQWAAEEQRLAEEYLKGLEAFGQENWNLAIDFWGPIWAIRPDYQNGVLEQNLRLACANSPRTEEPQCP